MSGGNGSGGRDAGEAEDKNNEFAFSLPRGRRPREDVLWTAIGDCFAKIAESFGPGRKQSATRAEILYEQLQAYYLLLTKCGYGTVRFRMESAGPLDALRRTLEPNGFPCGDLKEFRDRVRQERVWKFALEEAKRLEPAEEPEPASLLTEADAAAMNGAYIRIQSAGGDFFLEPAFAVEMLEHWEKPLLTTTAHAVETTHMIERLERSLLERSRAIAHASDPDAAGVSLLPDPPRRAGARAGERVSEHVLTFVNACYADGLFTDVNHPDQDLYGTSSGIAVFKAARDLACNERCATRDELEALFPGHPGRYLEIRERVVQRLEELLRTSSGTVVELNHAVRILWNTTPEDNRNELHSLLKNARPKLITFLKDCIRWLPPSGSHGRLAAFTASRGSNAVCLTACLGALRLVEHAELRDAELEAHIEAATDYVRACQTRGSGFGSSIRHRPDILHTYMAISFLKESDHRALLNSTLKRSVVEFARSCQKAGGYAILPEWKPSAYGTRLGFQIFQRLELPVPDRAEMKTFIEALRTTFANGTEEGFLGRPMNAAGLPV